MDLVLHLPYGPQRMGLLHEHQTHHQNSNIINTTLSVKGSRIIPNLDTKLNFRATIPSKESDNPIIAIIKIKI